MRVGQNEIVNRRTLGAATAVVLLGMGGVLLVSREAATQRDPNEVRTVVVANDCDDAVWVFYGRTPPLRPQDALSLAPGASAAQPMLEGDVVWLLDEQRSPVDHAIVEATTLAVIVDASCRSIAPDHAG